MGESPFRIDILNASGVRQGSGPLRNVTSLSDTRSLDKTGTLTFTAPASDPLVSLINAFSYFDAYDEVDGYIGRFLFKSKRLQATPAGAQIVVNCWDLTRLLSYRTVGFRRSYNYEAVEDVLDDIISLVPGWSITTESGLGSVVLDLQGESVTRAIDEVRDRKAAHWRLSGPDDLEFGYFGAASPVRLVGLATVDPVDLDNYTEIAVITSFSEVLEEGEIFNRVIPVGQGQGIDQLTIEGATAGSYAVESALNDDGTLHYFIEDDASIAAIGLRERILSLPNIRPISNSDTDILNAKNTLKLAAESYMSNHLDAIKTYSVSVAHLRQDLRVGDLIRVIYKEERDGQLYIDLDDTFYIMDVSRSREVEGARTAAVTISSVNARRTSDQDVMIDVVRSLKDINLHLPAYMTYSPIGPYNQRILGDATPANRINPSFTVRIQQEVLALNSAILRFKTSPLKSSATGASAGGSSSDTSAAGGDHHHLIGTFVTDANTLTPQRVLLAKSFNGAGNQPSGALVPWITEMGRYDTNPGDTWFTAQSSGTHTHVVNVPAHTHPITYGLFEDTSHPQNIGIFINGADVTVALGGPWAPSNAPIDITEIDIEPYLNGASGGLRQDHTVEFYSTTGRGEIEFEVDMTVTIQPIAVV